MVQLLPKKKVEVSTGQKILLYFSLSLLIILIVGYFVFSFLDKRVNQKIKETKELIAQTRNSSEIQTEEDIKTYEKKLNSFSFILDKHSFPSKVFPLLERDTLPRVYFTKFDLNPENLTLNLDGVTDNFQILGEQILVFRRDPLIRNVSLRDISIKSIGMVQFSLGMSLSPKLIVIYR